MSAGNRLLPVAAAASLTVFLVVSGLSGTPAVGQVTVSESPPRPKPEWLQDSGTDLRIGISGEVVDENGAPVDDCRLAVTVRTRHGLSRLNVVKDRNRFRFWVPVGEAGWFGLSVSAWSPDGIRTAREAFPQYRIRQAANEGLKLTLKPAERYVDVTVLDHGNPVSDANVTAEVAGDPFAATTNLEGVARFPFTQRDQLSQLTAWTHDFRIGGYSFNRKPPRNPSGDKHTIELETCRPQVFRLLKEEDGLPAANLPFLLIVGTGEPDFQYVGRTPESELRTNEAGEAVYRWFPDWKKHGSYIEILDPRWVKAGKAGPGGMTALETAADGATVVRVRKSRFDSRKRVVGQIAVSEGSPGGFHVQMRSFQGEEANHSDHLEAFTDENGMFWGSYLPGATYYVYVDDARYVSNTIDLLPWDPVADVTKSPSLTVSPGQPVEITVTSGPAKTPIPYQDVSLRTQHDFSWEEGAKTQYGIGGRQWYVTTDEAGKARAFAPPGKVTGNIFNPDWSPKTTINVKPDGVTQLDFHRE